jgi:hypothetical protein
MRLSINGPSGPLRIGLALLLGVAAMGYGAYSYTAQTSALDSAETVEATVVSTGVEEVDQRRGTEYRPLATFNYSYGGERYTASNVYPGTLPREFDTREAAAEALSGYEPGDSVTAYVPPESPGNAYLKHESSNKPFLVIGVGALFVAGAVRSVLS